MYLSDQEAVITRQLHRHCRQVDVNALAICYPLELSPRQARNLERINILQPHQPLRSPPEVLQIGEIGFFLLVT